jgi:hypothetical protein
VTDRRAPVVVAHVLLRSASGERPGEHRPITAETLGELRPPADAQAAVAEHLTGAGFEVPPSTDITVTIVGTKARFERHFGVKLRRGDDGAYTVVAPTEPRDAPTRAATSRDISVGATELPVGRLPKAIRDAIASVSLEVPMTPDEGWGTTT